MLEESWSCKVDDGHGWPCEMMHNAEQEVQQAAEAEWSSWMNVDDWQKESSENEKSLWEGGETCWGVGFGDSDTVKTAGDYSRNYINDKNVVYNLFPSPLYATLVLFFSKFASSHRNSMFADFSACLRHFRPTPLNFLVWSIAASNYIVGQGCQTYGSWAKTGPLGCSIWPLKEFWKLKKIHTGYFLKLYFIKYIIIIINIKNTFACKQRCKPWTYCYS